MFPINLLLNLIFGSLSGRSTWRTAAWYFPLLYLFLLFFLITVLFDWRSYRGWGMNWSFKFGLFLFFFVFVLFFLWFLLINLNRFNSDWILLFLLNLFFWTLLFLSNLGWRKIFFLYLYNKSIHYIKLVFFTQFMSR